MDLLEDNIGCHQLIVVRNLYCAKLLMMQDIMLGKLRLDCGLVRKSRQNEVFVSFFQLFVDYSSDIEIMPKQSQNFK